MLNQEQKNFLVQWICFVLFFLPIVYLGSIAAVTIHEVVGHGVVAALLGGDFLGFGILIDAMGWARVDIADISLFKQAIVLAGGTLLTNLCSIFFLVLGIRLKKSPLSSVALLTLAFTFLCDGLPYYFWDALFHGGIGDASGILGLYPVIWLRILMIVLSGVATVVTSLLLNHILLNSVYSFLGTKGKSHRYEFIMLACTLFVIQTAAWLSFDWTQLIPVPEIGLWPSVIPVVMTIVYIGVRIALFERRKPPVPADRPVRFKAAILTAWALCLVTIVVILLFLQNGVAL